MLACALRPPVVAQERCDAPRQVLNTSSDVIVIMLGTNDAKDASDGGPPNWENNGVTGEVEYIADYAWMVAQFNALPSRPDIFVTIPVPNYKPGVYAAAVCAHGICLQHVVFALPMSDTV